MWELDYYFKKKKKEDDKKKFSFQPEDGIVTSAQRKMQDVIDRIKK